jgi:hypothetical protein
MRTSTLHFYSGSASEGSDSIGDYNDFHQIISRGFTADAVYLYRFSSNVSFLELDYPLNPV